MLAHAAGEAAVIEASLVKVTARGLFAWPLAPTVRGVVRVCDSRSSPWRSSR